MVSIQRQPPCIYMYIHIYICMIYVCIYIYIYTYIHTLPAQTLQKKCHLEQNWFSAQMPEIRLNSVFGVLDVLWGCCSEGVFWTALVS